MQENKVHAHANGEVRDAATDMLLAIYRDVGRDSLMGYLSTLRQQQQREIEDEFSKIDAEGGGRPAKGKGAKQDAAFAGAEDEAQMDESYSSLGCNFCGWAGPTSSEQELDLHYWKDCPMLMQCAYCKQVVEIAGNDEHLLNECE
jgi:hypothetical protein